jgi:DNA-binding IclR family transcriptional regulator
MSARRPSGGAELNAMAGQGVAVEDQEHTTGINAIAAPIRDESGIAAALGLSAPASRIALEAMVDHLTPHLRSTADRISARLGYRRAGQRGEH